MSSSGKAGNGRGNNRKRPHRRRYIDGDNWQKGGAEQRTGAPPKRSGENFRGERVSFVERSKWTPPRQNTEPLPASICPWCGKPIRDISSAIADKDSGVPVHFDCVTARIAFGEKLEKGETVAYIGGGRFGIVCFGNSGDSSRDSSKGQARAAPADLPGSRDLIIRKIIEWENKDKRAEWRSVISDHYSVT